MDSFGIIIIGAVVIGIMIVFMVVGYKKAKKSSLYHAEMAYRKLIPLYKARYNLNISSKDHYSNGALDIFLASYDLLKIESMTIEELRQRFEKKIPSIKADFPDNSEEVIALWKEFIDNYEKI